MIIFFLLDIFCIYFLFSLDSNKYINMYNGGLKRYNQISSGLSLVSIHPIFLAEITKQFPPLKIISRSTNSGIFGYIFFKILFYHHSNKCKNNGGFKRYSRIRLLSLVSKYLFFFSFLFFAKKKETIQFPT